MPIKRLFAVILSAALFTTPAFAASYKVDKDHSTVSFKIKHLFSNVVGTFRDYQGTFEYEPGKPESWSAQGSINAASIDTNVEGRDKHLRNPDFFDVEKFPSIDFKTTKITATGENTATAEGTLTLHGVEKPVQLDVEIHGVGKDPWGNTRAAFTATTKINRKDFGLGWNQALETGQLLVGEEVTITLEIEGLLQDGGAATAKA